MGFFSKAEQPPSLRVNHKGTLGRIAIQPPLAPGQPEEVCDWFPNLSYDPSAQSRKETVFTEDLSSLSRRQRNIWDMSTTYNVGWFLTNPTP